VTLFGVSAVGYRNEGGFNGPGQPANQWAVWERTGLVAAPVPGCDLWRDPAEALDRAASCGAEAFVLGIEWARVEPRPEQPDPAALEGYARILGMCAERGMLPVVVLADVAHPEWLGEEFWLTPGSPDRFADHVARVCDELGGLCRHWVTVRQPNLVALAGWLGGRHPPRRYGAAADAWAVLDNLLAAHVLAYDAIHGGAGGRGAGGRTGLGRHPDPADQGGVRGEAGAPVVMLGTRASSVYDWARLPVDLLLARGAGVDLSDAAALGGWTVERRRLHDAAVPPRDLAELALRRAAAVFSPAGPSARRGLRRDRDSDRDCGMSPRRALDVVGARPSAAAPLDALYVVWRRPSAEWGVVPPGVTRLVAGVRSPRRGSPAEPGALGTWLRDERSFAPDLPLWVEDGFGTPRAPDTKDVTPGSHVRGAERPDRPRYLRRAVAEVCPVGGPGDRGDQRVHAEPRGSADGVPPVAAYVYHSLAGGGEPTTPDADFGLFCVSQKAGSTATSWCDTDGCGAPSADAFRRLVEECCAGER